MHGRCARGSGMVHGRHTGRRHGVMVMAERAGTEGSGKCPGTWCWQKWWGQCGGGKVVNEVSPWHMEVVGKGRSRGNGMPAPSASESMYGTLLLSPLSAQCVCVTRTKRPSPNLSNTKSCFSVP